MPDLEARERLLELVAARVAAALGEIPRELVHDVYAAEVALRDRGDARPPDAELSWNTEAHLARTTPANRWNAGSWARAGSS